MFHHITMINYSRSLRERAAARKSVGPYTWEPSKPMTGRGFYQASRPKHSDTIAVDARGSTFDLRLEYAESARCGGWSKWGRDTYAYNGFGDAMSPIIALLPHSRGFLAGWTMGPGMAASLDATIYETREEASRAAHHDARRAADDQADYEAEQELEDEEG